MWTCSRLAATLILISGVCISAGEASQLADEDLSHSSGLSRAKRAVPSLTKKFHMKGTYKWQLLFDIDNTNNSGTVERTVEIKTSEYISYSELQKAASSYASSAKIGFEAGIPFDIINIGVSSSVNIDIKKDFSRVTESKREIQRNKTRQDKYKVGPRSRLKLYRLVFNGPGMYEMTDTLSSTPHKMDDVDINITGRQKYILKDLKVKLTRDAISRPENSLNEVNNKNPDINLGYGGDYVWLVPSWTLKVDEGVTGLQFVRQSEGNKDYVDLASGARGDYRYMKVVRNKFSNERITEIALYRNPKVDPKKEGWDYVSVDINEGRGKDDLFVVWRVVRV